LQHSWAIIKGKILIISSVNYAYRLTISHGRRRRMLDLIIYGLIVLGVVAYILMRKGDRRFKELLEQFNFEQKKEGEDGP